MNHQAATNLPVSHGLSEPPWEPALRETFKRYPAATSRAARLVRLGHRDLGTVRILVLGVIGRHVDPDNRAILRIDDDGLRLQEDLGLDSLSIVELLMVFEEALDISVPQEKLRSLRTIGDIVGLVSSPGRA